MFDTIRVNMDLSKLKMTKQDILELLNPIISYHKDYPKVCQIITMPMFPFKISIMYNKLIIIGSLCKFYHGNNLNTLSRKQVRHAIQKMEEISGLPIRQFKVTRLDVSDNIITSLDANEYIEMVESLGNWKENSFKQTAKFTGKYFKTGDKELLLYVKWEEFIKKNSVKNRSKLPFNIIGQHYEIDEFLMCSKQILRIEFRYMKNVSKQVGVENLRMQDLYKKSIYNSIVRHWVKLLFKISYGHDIIMDLEDLNLKHVEDCLMIAGMEKHGGYAKVNRAIRRVPTGNDSALRSRKGRLLKKLRILGNKSYVKDPTCKKMMNEVRRKAVQLALQHIEKRPFEREYKARNKSNKLIE
jgi:hypothetical protein